ncbi:MAG: ABC transporter ATP-binding protein [Pseudomonadota bacterium]
MPRPRCRVLLQRLAVAGMALALPVQSLPRSGPVAAAHAGRCELAPWTMQFSPFHDTCMQGVLRGFEAGPRLAREVDGRAVGRDDGNLVVFAGLGGCGKTTLLHTIAGLESASAGRVPLAGRSMRDERPGKRGLAMLLQSHAPYPHTTVRQNLGFGMRMRGVPAATVAARLERAVKLLALDPCLDRRPGELAGGQCQRVAIGRAFVQEPEAVLFDEPLSDLDAELRLRMRPELAALHRELGATVVCVTPDQVEAMALAQRIVVLRAGRIEQVGAPMQPNERPADSFVARFIGAPAMNLLARAAVPALPAHAPAATTGIRSEHLVASPAGPPPLEVRGVERLGARTWLRGVLTGTGHALAVESRKDTAGGAPGACLLSGPLPGRVRAFDSDGQRTAYRDA